MANDVMPHAVARPLSKQELSLIDAWWRAANYLSVGQIYLLDNPLLKEPLKLEHIKPRLLGHWGTTPGQNFIYVHLNRAIKARTRYISPIPPAPSGDWLSQNPSFAPGAKSILPAHTLHLCLHSDLLDDAVVRDGLSLFR